MLRRDFLAGTTALGLAAALGGCSIGDPIKDLRGAMSRTRWNPLRQVSFSALGQHASAPPEQDVRVAGSRLLWSVRDTLRDGFGFDLTEAAAMWSDGSDTRVTGADTHQLRRELTALTRAERTLTGWEVFRLGPEAQRRSPLTPLVKDTGHPAFMIKDHEVIVCHYGGSPSSVDAYRDTWLDQPEYRDLANTESVAAIVWSAALEAHPIRPGVAQAWTFTRRPDVTLTMLFRSAGRPAAERLAEELQRNLDARETMLTQRPLRELLPASRVDVNGNVVQFLTHAEPARTLEPQFVDEIMPLFE